MLITGPVTLNGAPNMGIDVGSGLKLSGTLSYLPVTYWLLFSEGRDGSGKHHGHYGGVRAFK